MPFQRAYIKAKGFRVGYNLFSLVRLLVSVSLKIDYPYYTISKCALSFKLFVDCGAPFEPLRGFSCSRQLGGR